MGIKFLAIALVAVLSLQGMVQAKSITVHEDRGIVEDITKMVEEVKASITKLIVEGIATVKKAFDQIMVIAQQEMNKAMQEIQHLAEEAIADIKEFERVSKELGIDIEECVKEMMPRILQLQQETQEAVSACFADMVAEFTQMYEDLLAATTASYDTIFGLVQKFDECQDWACRGQTAKQLVQEMMRINGETRIIIDRAVRRMQEQLPATVECMKAPIANFKTEMATIVADIKTCVGGSSQTKVAPLSIEDDIAKLVEHVKQAMEDLIQGAVAGLKEAHDAIVAFTQKLVAEARAKIQELAAKLHADIEAIKKEAEELGYDIQECVDAALPKIETLVKQTEAELTACVEATLSTAAGIYDKVIVIVNEVQQTIVDLVDSAKACKDIGCYIEVGKNFYAVLVRISGEINQLVADSTVELEGAIETLIGCSEPTMQNYVTGMQTIGDEIRQCLATDK